MFERRGNKIICDAGWQVETSGRGEIRYTDADRIVAVGAEMLAAGPAAFAVYSNDMVLIEPATGKLSDELVRAMILERIVQAFAATGAGIEID